MVSFSIIILISQLLALKLTSRSRPISWQFDFDKAQKQTIKVASLFDYSIYRASTYVCPLFKKFEMQQLKFDLGSLDPTIGTLASQKANLDQMKGWEENPLK